MHTGLHAVGTGFLRLGIVLAVLVLGAALAYTLLVLALVIGQAGSAFAQ